MYVSFFPVLRSHVFIELYLETRDDMRHIGQLFHIYLTLTSVAGAPAHLSLKDSGGRQLVHV